MTLEELKQQREALDTQIKVMESRGEFVPDICDKYYVLSADKWGSYRWDGLNTDKGIFDRNQVYRTEVEAKRADNRRMAEMRIFRKLRELEGDWVCKFDGTQLNYLIYFHEPSHSFGEDSWSKSQHIPDRRYFSSREACQWVINNMQNDLKLVWGVK